MGGAISQMFSQAFQQLINSPSGKYMAARACQEIVKQVKKKRK